MRYVVPAFVTLATLAVAGASATAIPAAPTEAVAAVFPPWWDRGEAAAAVAAADGLIVREGALGSILIVRPTDPFLAERLRANGAVMILDARAARGCLGTA